MSILDDCNLYTTRYPKHLTVDQIMWLTFIFEQEVRNVRPRPLILDNGHLHTVRGRRIHQPLALRAAAHRHVTRARLQTFADLRVHLARGLLEVLHRHLLVVNVEIEQRDADDLAGLGLDHPGVAQSSTSGGLGHQVGERAARGAQVDVAFALTAVTRGLNWTHTHNSMYRRNQKVCGIVSN